jgi:hypothetical protein
MYAIICDARLGKTLGVKHLALVDRKLTRRMWWTTNSKALIAAFSDLKAAEEKAAQLAQNNARVVPHEKAQRMIEEQKLRIEELEAAVQQKEQSTN